MEFKLSLNIIFVILCISNVSSTIRTFWRGRHHGGNLGGPSKSEDGLESNLLPAAQWFEQNLDHFDPTNSKTWQQRFYVNDTFYKPNGPVFLMIGGEGEAKPKWMVEGAWLKYAQKYNALCFQLEHRYYGKSFPTADLSTKNLVFLSSEQALADLSNFIKGMNKKYTLNQENTKWIAFGGSYPGSLAAWLREKYPHLVHGSISSSGPLLAKANFIEYFKVVEDSLATYSQNCVNAVRKGIAQVEVLLRHMIGQKTLDDKFQLCTPIEKSINNMDDIAGLYEAIASNFAGVVQYNKDNSPHAIVTIDDICSILVNQTIGPPVNRLAAASNYVLDKTNISCLIYKYDDQINELRNISLTSPAAEGARQWTYQTCTEFGFYQTSDADEQLFGDRFPLNYFVRQCSDTYGKNYNADLLDYSIRRTNMMYGALNPSTTNVLYVHGSIDPWHALGLTNSTNPKTPTIYITGTAHCANMYEPKDTDIESLKQARIGISNYIGNLLKQ